MGVKWRRLWKIMHLLLVLFMGIVTSTDDSPGARSVVVYRGCSAVRYDEGSAYQTNLGAFLDLILSQDVPPNSHFYNDSVGNGHSRVYGLFQCRGDVSNEACGDCKRRIVAQTPLLCGRTTGARVQLRECYLRYENSKFFGDPDQHEVYKTCSAETTDDPAFFAHREVVLTALEEKSSSGNNFRATSSDSDGAPPVVSGSAQCEGDLSWADCADCILTAARNVKDACGSSVSGQVYLQKCYIGYKIDEPHSHQDLETNHMTAKTVAIAIGGVAAAIFLFIFLLFLKSLCKTDGESAETLAF